MLIGGMNGSFFLWELLSVIHLESIWDPFIIFPFLYDIRVFCGFPVYKQLLSLVSQEKTVMSILLNEILFRG